MQRRGGVRVFPHSFIRFQSRCGRWLAGSLALAIGALWLQPAQAEGSRSLISGAAGLRPFLDARGAGVPGGAGFTAGTPRRTFINVYAEPGETLNLGSSANGINAGRINFTAPDGTTGTCALPNAGNNFAGRILTLAEELAGPDAAPFTGPGYTPCIVTVGAGQAGIWQIDFTSPNPNSAADPPPTATTAPWVQGNNVSWVAAWDVTVRDTGGTLVSGRTYTNYLPLNLGTNNPGNALTSTLFIQTIDGYLYQVAFRNIDPFGFIFFSNSQGFLGSPGTPNAGQPLYQSVLAPQANPPAFQRPFQPDVLPNQVTHKIFFNDPRTNFLPPTATLNNSSTWLRPAIVTPPTPTNFRFEGVSGTPNQAGTNAPGTPFTGNSPPFPPYGGFFVFDAPPLGSTPVSYRVTIDANQNGTFGDANDRVIQGSAVGNSTNRVYWDGLDGNGQPLPPGNLPTGAEITLNVGEVHFPLLDVETNLGGIEVQRIQPVLPNPFQIFFDDRSLPGAGTGANGLFGVNSSGGAHTFGTNFGDNRGIDTWALVPSAPARLTVNIILAQADLAITKASSPNPFTAGAPVTYTLTVTNNGPSNVTGARVLDTVPNTISNVTWTCAITSAAGTGSCGAASGTGNTIDTTVNLNNGAIATYTINGTLSATATGNVDNSAQVLTPNDVTDPNDLNRQGAGNNGARLATPIVPAAPRIGVAKQAGTIVNNQDGTFTVPYTVLVRNVGSVDLQNVQVTEELTTTFSGAVGFQVTAAPTSSTLTVNPNFNGRSDIRLLAGTDTLPVNGSATINFTVRVTPGTNLGPYNNTVIATGTPPGSNTPVTDISTDGPNIDPNNNGNPGDDNTPTTISFTGDPRLRLVKRVTAVTRSGVPFTFSNFVNDPNDLDDDAPGWSQLPPVGVTTIDATNPLRSGDEVEYTVYFLSDGGLPALTTNLCDPISAGSTFVTNTNQISVANASPTTGGTFFSPLAPLTSPNSCLDQTNPNGTLIFDLGTVSNTPGSNFGFIRFRVRID